MHLSRPAFAPLAIAVSVTVVASVATIALRSGSHAAYELMREGSPLAVLSELLLCASAVVAALIAWQDPSRRAFLLLVPALGLLALDERLMGHERLKHALLQHVFDWNKQAMGRWGDLPLALVAAGGFGILWTLRQHLRRSPRVLRLLTSALVLGVLAISLDIATTREGVQAVEELLEVAAETLFLLALLAVWTSETTTAGHPAERG